MFGVLKPTSGAWNCSLRNEWAGHFCGTCLALGDAFGQPARLATNFDAVLISALTEAQCAEPAARTSHVCPLRGFRRLAVVAPSAPGAQYAASLSMFMVATKIDDHAADGDGFVGQLPTFFTYLARRMRKTTRQVARRLGFDIRGIAEAVSEQVGREAQSGRGFLYYSEPTERSVAAAFAHTAQIAERPENRSTLAEVGGLFGRLVFLLDSYRDLDDDRRAGGFNALAASSEEGGEKLMGQRLFRDAHARICQLLDDLHLTRPRLVRQLLVEELGAAGERTLGVAMTTVANEEERQGTKRRRQRKDSSFGCWGGGWGGSSCDCCGDSSCDCCGVGDCCCCPCDC